MASNAQRAANKRAREKNREKWNAYCRKRTRERYHGNREYFLDALGGACYHCGNSDKRVLEFDHINPWEKVKSVSALLQLANRDKIREEVDKCRLLCANCHKIKSLESGDYCSKALTIKKKNDIITQVENEMRTG